MSNNNCKKCNEELLVFEDKEKGICMPCLWKEMPLLNDEEKYGKEKAKVELRATDFTSNEQDTK